MDMKSSEEASSLLQAAHVLGTHLEGPFITEPGAHPKELLRVPEQGFASVLEVYGGSLASVRIVTMAPDVPYAKELCQGLIFLFALSVCMCMWVSVLFWVCVCGCNVSLCGCKCCLCVRVHFYFFVFF